MNITKIKDLLKTELPCVKTEIIEKIASILFQEYSDKLTEITIGYTSALDELKTEYQTKIEDKFVYPEADNVVYWTAGDFAKSMGYTMKNKGSLHKFVEARLSSLGFRPAYSTKNSDISTYPCNSPLIKKIVKEYFEEKDSRDRVSHETA